MSGIYQYFSKLVSMHFCMIHRYIIMEGPYVIISGSSEYNCSCDYDCVKP